jgi:CRISPR-associated protein Cas2
LEILVTYDVAVDTAAGRRRLRRVAKVCEAYGQRVQKSVFECMLSPAQFELLKHRLRTLIDEGEDSLRFYRLLEPRERHVQVVGKQPAFDLHDPLVL